MPASASASAQTALLQSMHAANVTPEAGLNYIINGRVNIGVNLFSMPVVFVQGSTIPTTGCCSCLAGTIDFRYANNDAPRFIVLNDRGFH